MLRALSEAEEARSPERMGINRPPVLITSPFALAALQAQGGVDPKTEEAVKVAVMSQKGSPMTQPQVSRGRGPPPRSAASALEGLQAELAKGGLPSAASAAPGDLESLGRPTAKAASPGQPPPAMLPHLCAVWGDWIGPAPLILWCAFAQLKILPDSIS